jgi:lipopolysaccharide export system protein LptA
VVRLEKLHIYNVIRVLRVALPLVVVAFAALGILNYLARRPASSPPAANRRLVDNVAELSEDVRFSRSEGGRPVFTVEADQNVGTEDGWSVLEGVRIRIFGQDISSPDRLISSPYCNVDSSTGDIACTGDAEIQFDDHTTIESTSLVYVNADRIIRTLEAARVVRPGEFEVDAGELVLDLDGEIAELRGNVVVRASGRTRLETELIRYFQAEDRAEISGGLRLRAGLGELRGRDARVRMIPGTLSPEIVSVEGRVTAFSADDVDPVSIGADAVELRLAGNLLRSVVARGAASAQTGLAPESRTLSGNVLEGFFSAAGTLESVEARGEGRLVAASGEELRAPVIRNALGDSTVVTQGPSRFETDRFRVDGTDFRVRGDDRIVFETDRRATIRMSAMSTMSTMSTMAGGSLEGEVTRAVMDGDTGELVELVQTGNARFERNGRTGTADRIAFSGQDRVRLSGNAEVREPELKLAAPEIELDLASEQFQASGGVEAVVTDAGTPVLVVGSEAEGGREQIRVRGAAQLWRGDVHIAAVEIDMTPGDRAFTATGQVRSMLEGYRVEAERLDFDDPEGKVEYMGSVRARSGEVDFDSDRLEVFLAPDGAAAVVPPGGSTRDIPADPIDRIDRIIRIIATGKVEIRDADRTGRGDEAVYSRETGTVILRGSDAEVSGGAGSAHGPEFTWNVDEDRVVMTGTDGRPAVSRRPVEDPQ